MVVLVTGASGQLGQSLQFIASQYAEMQFIFASSQDLDITNQDQVNTFFDNNKIDFCINTAAYTAVDKAESDQEKAYLVNVIGPKNLAIACEKVNATLVHVSTDFVFNGSNKEPYFETDQTNPLGVYGQTKLEGENEVMTNCTKCFIIRTSWVYSQFGNNFMKTMLRLAQGREELNVVADQIGTPTNAVDLANAILKILEQQSTTHNSFGIYNFSNEGVCSWFDFAVEIFKQNSISIKVNPIPTEAYPTPAKRPKYSVLDKTKIKTNFKITIKDWKEALAQTKLQ
ncbi:MULTISPECIES: dTDP-4-dehydrorhamnose reductase [Flavobacterium]|uniref:dTDP-4-dehydrorhamnose reductase n=1 Tax=Flavobacterium columnare TaxID=996 RepID=A0AA94JP04_9FLAO|nr:MULTISPECIES: dTDP-4-dehydrorhamnose reductase [Flavobacterium]OXA82627.1 NAD(P)-dependent oxidoreductase [Flavobacterium columnare NBRC 100251 = ATCC 23463]AMA48012.1 NAD(P)-dependent oxidoreductase [Flavobacterium covae]AND63846.1 NAD(P)-dependent oxidoreductase [Flavobacterium covae]MCH4829911.1 dTDP-4-dehydrorhamnose reductase [Flavobacterium columnare]MCH4832708.1 dTDP-4-dehydrorhamnose reductase [Flavobacterium columnare]